MFLTPLTQLNELEMIKIDRNNAFSGLKFDTEGAKIQFFFANWSRIVHPGKCVALGKGYAKNPVKDFD